MTDRSRLADLSDDDLGALVALSALPGIGPATLLGWQRGIGAGAAWRAVVAGRAAGLPGLRPHGRTTLAEVAATATAAARSVEPAALLERHREAGIQVLVHGGAGYPEPLLHDPSPPAVLYVRGDVALLDEPAIAIVGTRNATHVGCRTATRLAAEVADHEIHVVSGLALGIDGAAHRGVLEHGDRPGIGARAGRPIGVVACGLDRAYPARHRDLQRAVAASGAVVSEHPLGTPPAPWRFPARNRIIACLGRALVVVESRSRGGSMLTVAEALARDRPVLAIPGHPSSPAAAGTLDLLADGALVLRDVQDLLVAIGRGGHRPSRTGGEVEDPERGAHAPLDEIERLVLDLLAVGPTSLEELVAAAGRPVLAVAAAVDVLERRGRLARNGLWLEAKADGARRA